MTSHLAAVAIIAGGIGFLAGRFKAHESWVEAMQDKATKKWKERTGA